MVVVVNCIHRLVNKEFEMYRVYVAVRLIVEIGEPEQVLGCYEFEAPTWMDALDNAYAWLKQY